MRKHELSGRAPICAEKGIEQQLGEMLRQRHSEGNARLSAEEEAARVQKVCPASPIQRPLCWHFFSDFSHTPKTPRIVVRVQVRY